MMTDAQALTLSLGGHWYRSYGVAPCPVCQPEARRDQHALTLADGANGRLLLSCKKSNCPFTDILAAAGVRAGSYTPPDPATISQREAEAREEAEKKAWQAWTCWSEARPIEGTPAEAYLRGRGITCTSARSLRFHPGCWHGPTAQRLPAMVAKVEGVERFAVHRTFIQPDGSGKADVPAGTSKMMLGATRGGAVRLTDGSFRLVVTEGIETALSLASGLLPGPATIWAALSTSGMTALRLPQHLGRLTIATDGDEAGRAAGHALAERAHALGWTVSLLPAPNGRDWNDVIRMKGAAA